MLANIFQFFFMYVGTPDHSIWTLVVVLPAMKCCMHNPRRRSTGGRYIVSNKVLMLEM